jgi:hypothetical protein
MLFKALPCLDRFFGLSLSLLDRGYSRALDQHHLLPRSQTEGVEAPLPDRVSCVQPGTQIA